MQDNGGNVADLYLEAGDILNGLTFGGRVFGTAGSETVTYAAGTTGIVIDQNVDEVRFVESSSALTFQQQGNQLVIFRGTDEVARIGLQGDLNGTLITFPTGRYEAKVSAAGMTLGGTIVPSEVAGRVVLESDEPRPQYMVLNLTPGIDKLIGTNGDSIFNALPVNSGGATATTLTASDELDGGAGVDILNIYTTATENTVLPSTTSIRNIEIINILNAGPPAPLTDLSKYPGIQQFWQKGSATDVTNLSEGTSAGFGDLRSATTATVRTVDTAKSAVIAVQGGSPSILHSLTVSNETASGKLDTVTVTGKATANSNAAQLALTVQAGRDVETVTVSSSANIKLAVVESAGSTTHVRTIDGSGSTGALTFDLNGLKASTSIAAFDGGKIMLGSGADLLSAPTTGATVAGLQKGAGEDATKAGSADTIVLTGAVQASDATDATFAVKDGLLSFTGGAPASLADALAVARAAAAADNATLVFQYLGDSYVFGERSNATVSDDVLIKLEGTTGLSGLDTYAANSVYLF